MNPEATKALFTRVMDRMVEARWLDSHIFTDGKGFHLVWSLSGGERAVALRKIARTYGLMNDDRSAMCFDILAHGERLPRFVRAFELDAEVAAFWRECVADLRLRADEDGLMAMVHIVEGWGPDAETKVRFWKGS